MLKADLPTVLLARQTDTSTLRSFHKRGAVTRIRRGAYLKAAAPERRQWKQAERDALSRCIAVNERLDTHFAFSHVTAALLWGWPAPVRRGEVEVVQPSMPTYLRGSDVRRHWRPDLSALDMEHVAGLPATTPRRTLLDCLCSLSTLDGLVLADAAFADLADMDVFARQESELRQATLRSELLAQLAELGPQRGVVRARTILEYANGFSGSPGESRTRWLALTAGLPVPTCQWEIWVDGKQYFSDLAWLASATDWTSRAITLEYDGVAKYGATGTSAAAVVLQEKEREDSIRSTGARVYRVTAGTLTDPQAGRRWLLSKFPASTLATLTPRPGLIVPERRRRPR